MSSITGRGADADNAGPLLPTRDVCARYKVNIRTIERWLVDDKLGFPAPIFINKRRYFRERDLVAFERSHVVTA
jgi:hypothetical protein